MSLERGRVANAAIAQENWNCRCKSGPKHQDGDGARRPGPVQLLHVLGDDELCQIGWRHRRLRNQRLENGRVGPARTGLGLFGADHEAGGVFHLVSDLEHVHQTRVAPEDVETKSAIGRNALEWAGIIVAALLAALIIKTFLLQAFYIPSESMDPTLKVGDRVLVTKLTYHFHPPRRGDVIVFQNPHPRPGHQHPLVAFAHWLGQGLGFSQGGRNKDYIKRVIGLPGDTVEIHQGVVFVNGVELHEPYISPIRDNGSYGPYHVPQGCLFVLGDNRTDSDDSRGSLGFIPIGKVLGRAFVIV